MKPQTQTNEVARLRGLCDRAIEAVDRWEAKQSLRDEIQKLKDKNTND